MICMQLQYEDILFQTKKFKTRVSTLNVHSILSCIEKTINLYSSTIHKQSCMKYTKHEHVNLNMAPLE